MAGILTSAAAGGGADRFDRRPAGGAARWWHDFYREGDGGDGAEHALHGFWHTERYLG